jgi:iron(III) transport system ATP-binding protein
VASAALQVVGLTKSFGATLAVDAVDLEVAPGGFLALLGPSGCGPRTLVPPERRRVGMVFQEGALFPHLSVADNIAYGLQGGSQRQKRVGDLLELIGLPSVGHRMPHELSGGEQQRVALARALAPEPALVLLDEPFSSLDAALRARLRQDVRAILRQAGATAITVTHDQNEAFSLADEVAVMWRGRIAQRSSPEQLYAEPASREIAAFVGEANFLTGHVGNGAVETELGRLPARGAAEGDVEVLVRPEMLRLTPDLAADAVISDVEFFGHDRMYSVTLPSGTQLRVRVPGDADLRQGDRIRVAVVGGVTVFPKERAS